MKSTIFIFFFSALFTIGFADTVNFHKEGELYILELPYEIPENTKRVFDRDSPFALKVIELIVDGKPITFFDDYGCPEGRRYWRIKDTPSDKGKLIIKLFWRYIPSAGLVWNDGSGIIPIKNGDVITYKTNSYLIEKGSKKVEIKYQVILPSDDLLENEFNLDYLKKCEKTKLIVKNVNMNIW